MIRIDEDPAAVGTVDANANGVGIPGFWTSGPICTILGPDWANHVESELALAIEGHGLTLDFTDKGQLNSIFENMTGIYGDGSFGSATITLDTVMATDRYYEDLTINPGVTLDLGGRRLFVRGVLTIGDATVIANNGVDGADFAGTPPPFPIGGAGGQGHTVGGGGAGGDGGDGAGSVSVGSNPTPNTAEGYSGAGGKGGNGSPGVSQELGLAGGIIVSVPKNVSPAFTPAMQTGVVNFQNGGNHFNFMLCGGAGGGGGGAGSAAVSSNGYGGAGGGGGGVALICARTLVSPVAPAGAATIEAKGGAGGFDSTVGIANGGGGGGGGGGTILLTTRVRIGDPGLLVLDASGGAGGGATTGGSGVSGTTGAVFELFA